MINGLGLCHYLRAPGYSTSLQVWDVWRCQSVCHTGPPPSFGIAPKPQFCKSSFALYNGIFRWIEWTGLSKIGSRVLKLERDCLWWYILVSTPRCWCWQVKPETALMMNDCFKGTTWEGTLFLCSLNNVQNTNTEFVWMQGTMCSLSVMKIKVFQKSLFNGIWPLKHKRFFALNLTLDWMGAIDQLVDTLTPFTERWLVSQRMFEC